MSVVYGFILFKIKLFLYLFQGQLYLCKWENYHRQDSTWEPESHLSIDLINAFLTPPIKDTRLQTACDAFENAIQNRLSSKQSRLSIIFDLDIYRYVFGTDRAVLVTSSNELNKLPLSPNWYYKLKQNGKGLRISFPLRITPSLFQRRVYVREDQHVLTKSLPVEKVSILCAVEPHV